MAQNVWLSAQWQIYFIGGSFICVLITALVGPAKGSRDVDLNPTALAHLLKSANV